MIHLNVQLVMELCPCSSNYFDLVKCQCWMCQDFSCSPSMLIFFSTIVLISPLMQLSLIPLYPVDFSVQFSSSLLLLELIPVIMI